MKRNNLDILFKQYYERLVLFAESYVGDMMIAEDMVQDVFLTVLSRPDFADVGYMHAYLYSCVRNNCVNYLRRLDIVDPLNIKLFDAVYYTGDFDLEEEEKLILRVEEEIDKLPIQRRKVLKLSVYQGMSYSQIAEVTGLSVNTVKTHMKKAYQELREKLYNEHQELFLLFIFSLLRED